MSNDAVVVRAARTEDLEQVGRVAAQLVRLHHAWDAQRFMVVEPIEQGYRWWLGKEMANKEAVVLVATIGEAVVGYAYGRLEERDWNALLDVHGALHDILVDENARNGGV